MIIAKANRATRRREAEVKVSSDKVISPSIFVSSIFSSSFPVFSLYLLSLSFSPLFTACPSIIIQNYLFPEFPRPTPDAPRLSLPPPISNLASLPLLLSPPQSFTSSLLTHAPRTSTGILALRHNTPPSFPPFRCPEDLSHGHHTLLDPLQYTRNGDAHCSQPGMSSVSKSRSPSPPPPPL